MTAPDTKPLTPPADAEDGFLGRWSRRKRAASGGAPLPEAPPVAAQPVPPPTGEAAPRPPLPDPETLGAEDDFAAYLGREVPAALKRAAMQKLFADPHFNTMDGLDVYIEDYNLVPDLPAGEAALLAHAREVLNPTPAAEVAAGKIPDGPAPATDPMPPKAALAAGGGATGSAASATPNAGAETSVTSVASPQPERGSTNSTETETEAQSAPPTACPTGATGDGSSSGKASGA